VISFAAYTADPAFEEPGCIYAAGLYNAEQRARLASDPVALAAYVDVPPGRYAFKNFQSMMRSWTRQKNKADADAAAKAVSDAQAVVPEP
jgi:hypothetical protein